jgi:hypothetical protein
VIKAPLETSKKVLSKGIAKGFKGVIPNGGHTEPISTLGTKDE